MLSLRYRLGGGWICEAWTLVSVRLTWSLDQWSESQ